MSDVDFGRLAPDTRRKLERRLADAAQAFGAERFTDTLEILKSVERIAPGVVEVLELRGLSYYRLGRWREAVKDLEQFASVTDSVEQHPVLADSHRALGHFERVEQLWEELGFESPHPELLEEGRIVRAGALADQGRLKDALAVLERAPKPQGAPAVYHLRRWYVMGDLYERAGDRQRASGAFRAIVDVEPGFGDAAERAADV